MMIITAKEIGLDEVPLEPQVLFVKAHPRVRRSCVMQ